MDSKNRAQLIKAAPSNWWREHDVCARLRDHFRSHIVGLHVRFKQNEVVEHELFTGFLLSYEGLHFWLTAGHVVSTMREMCASESIEVLESHWIDHAPNEMKCPFRADFRHLVGSFCDTDGLDFGIVLLTRHDARLMNENPNIEFLTPEVWRGHEIADPEGFYVMGFPREWLHINATSATDDHSYTVKSEVACLPADRIEDRGKNANTGILDFWERNECFYGQLLSFADRFEHPVDNIEGMSGGPIFSVERTEESRIRYRLFGIQSHWLNESRIVRAGKMEEIAKILEGIQEKRIAMAVGSITE